MRPSCVIALHGLGADGSDLMSLQQMMNLEDVPWLFPNAPQLPVTVNGGLRMPAWFDILGFSPDDPIDLEGIRASAQRIQTLIAEQVATGIEPSGIMLLGFSQGGVIALHAALSGDSCVGAVVGLSTWLPAAEALALVSTEQKKTPIWLGHGRFDNIVPMGAHERAKAKLNEMGMRRVQTASYPMAHSILPEELGDLRGWLDSL